MASPSTRPCVLSKKRQHNLNEDYETDDIKLSTSHLTTLDESIVASKKLKAKCSASTQNSSSGYSDSESESESTPGEADNNVVVSATAICEEPAANITAVSEAPESPQPGPSKYEDITFEPAVTSTPHHSQEDADQDETTELGEEKQQARNFITKIEEEFMQEFRNNMEKTTAKHILKLKERRLKVSQAMINVKKDIKRFETTLAFLSNYKNEIDSAINKFNYLMDRYPY